MKHKEMLDIALEALRIIGSYKECDCGCPNARSARIAGTPVHVWHIANQALSQLEEVKVYENSSY